MFPVFFIGFAYIPYDLVNISSVSNTAHTSKLTIPLKKCIASSGVKSFKLKKQNPFEFVFAICFAVFINISPFLYFSNSSLP